MVYTRSLDLVLDLALGRLEVQKEAAVFGRPRRAAAETTSGAATTCQIGTVGNGSDDLVDGNGREEVQGRAAAASGAAAACFSLSEFPGLVWEDLDLEMAVQRGRSARVASRSQRGKLRS